MRRTPSPRWGPIPHRARRESLAFLLLNADYKNTVHLIANVLLALLTHPDQMAALREDPAKLPGAVDELARYNGPVLLGIRRFTREEVTIDEVTIPAGETVMLAVASANRDPERFDNADTLDPRRDDVGHLAFGHGVHYCLGASLARMETEIVLATLLRWLPGLALAVPRDKLTWRPSMRVRGLVDLPVRWTHRT